MGRTHDITISGFDLDRIESENKRLRAALEWIASQSTGQEASPTQCSMVVMAEDALSIYQSTDKQPTKSTKQPTATACIFEALREIAAETDGRNPSHIGQDRAHSIARHILSNVRDHQQPLASGEEAA